MGLDKIVHNDREPLLAKIFNAWVKDLESDILRTKYQENEQRLLYKYNNIRFLDDEYNKPYMIAPESLELKGITINNKQYCVVGQPLNWRGGDNLDVLISIEINYDFMVLIKGVEQDPDLGVKPFHPSIDDDSEATDSDTEGSHEQIAPKTPYDGENLNASSDDEGNNDEDAPKTPYDGENINAYSNNDGNNDYIAPDPPTKNVNKNANYDDEKNDYEVTPDTATNGVNIERLEMTKKKLLRRR